GWVQKTENRKKPKTKPNRGRKKPNRKNTEPKLSNRTEPNLIGSVSVFECNPNPRRRDPFPLSLFSVLWSLDPLSFLPNSAALPLRLLPSQRPASCVCGNPHGLIRKYGLMCCRQCFRSNAKEIGFIKISIQTSTSAGLEQTLPWIFYHKSSFATSILMRNLLALAD
ncbi:hypothetical protein DVH24_041280, partial [Malus domestica]